MKWILTEILKPAVHRVGSVLGMAVASTQYFTEGQAATLEAASVLVGGYLIDLVVRKVL